jgi:hypothetical protein
MTLSSVAVRPAVAAGFARASEVLASAPEDRLGSDAWRCTLTLGMRRSLTPCVAVTSALSLGWSTHITEL